MSGEHCAPCSGGVQLRVPQEDGAIVHTYIIEACSRRIEDTDVFRLKQ